MENGFLPFCSTPTNVGLEPKHTPMQARLWFRSYGQNAWSCDVFKSPVQKKKKRKTKTGKLIWKVRVSLPISVSLSPYCITLKLCKNVQTGDGWVLILCMIPLVLLSFPWWIIPDLKPSRSHHQGRILWWLAEINGPGFKRKPAASCFPKTKEAGYLHPSSKCSLNNNA